MRARIIVGAHGKAYARVGQKLQWYELGLPPPPFTPYTARQLQILQLASYGKRDPEIAVILGISYNTVKTHWKNLRFKYPGSARVSLVAKAIREGHIE